LNTEKQIKWDKRFLGLAKHVAQWSLDPSAKVGAVIVDEDKRLVSVGYNGFARGVKDDDRLLDRETKLKCVVHAEMNAILFANTTLKGKTLYTWPMFPCSNCCGPIIQSGIKRVVSIKADKPKWADSIILSINMFTEAGIEFNIYEV
jgi:dCMP deaminase